MTKLYKDGFGNMATIEKVRILPYQGARERQEAYRLSLQSMYDCAFEYHVSVHETFEEAKAKMFSFSCGTWTEKIEKSY